jgi:hypothetical protein
MATITCSGPPWPTSLIGALLLTEKTRVSGSLASTFSANFDSSEQTYFGHVYSILS